MYDTHADPYCYPGRSVLKNLPGIRDAVALERFETTITTQRAEEPLPAGRLSVRHCQAIHRHLFQDVYSWAGRLRTVRIAKGPSAFCYPEHIARGMRRTFGGLKEAQFLRGLAPQAFAVGAAHFLAELNAIHPFRDGNGRSQLVLLAVVGQQAGHPLDLQRLDREAYLTAMVQSFNGKEAALASLLQGLIVQP